LRILSTIFCFSNSLAQIYFLIWC